MPFAPIVTLMTTPNAMKVSTAHAEDIVGCYCSGEVAPDEIETRFPLEGSPISATEAPTTQDENREQQRLVSLRIEASGDWLVFAREVAPAGDFRINRICGNLVSRALLQVCDRMESFGWALEVRIKIVQAHRAWISRTFLTQRAQIEEKIIHLSTLPREQSNELMNNIVSMFCDLFLKLLRENGLTNMEDLS